MQNQTLSTRASINSISILILRLILGTVFFAHGAQKVFGAFGGRGIESVIGMVTSFGLPIPVVIGWIVALIEFVGGIAIILGLFTRIAAFGICINMSVAVFKVHLPNGFFAPEGVEFPLTLLAIALSIVFSGGGIFSLDYPLYRSLGAKNRFLRCLFS